MNRYKIIWPDGSTYDKKLKGFDCCFRYFGRNLRFRNVLSLEEAQLTMQGLITKTDSSGQAMFWDLTIQKVDETFLGLIKTEVIHLFVIIRHKLISSARKIRRQNK